MAKQPSDAHGKVCEILAHLFYSTQAKFSANQQNSTIDAVGKALGAFGVHNNGLPKNSKQLWASVNSSLWPLNADEARVCFLLNSVLDGGNVSWQ